jgi:Na+/H+-dicarboxylate symporter
MENGPWYFKLHWQVLIALILGIAAGIVLPGFAIAIGFIGDLFLRLLKMVIIPLIFTSLVSGVASLGDAKSVGRIGFRTLIYYTVTTTLAITVGLTLVNLIKPGTGLTIADPTDLPPGFDTAGQSLSEFLMRLIPDNVVSAMANGEVLPVITFAILFGLFLTRLDSPASRSVKQVVDGALEVIQLLTLAVVKLAPLGIFALLAPVVAESGVRVILDLWPYFLTVGLGLLIHAGLTLPVILLILGRRVPHTYFRKVVPAVATAFSTASSSATLPLSMECAEREAKLPKGVVSFVLPLGATVNMNGTALYECMAAMFIAQAYGLELSITTQFLVVTIALITSIGVAGVPSASLVAIAIILTAIGLPIEAIGVLLVFDRVLDMSRTATNVFGDACCTVIVARLQGEDLPLLARDNSS